MDNSWKNHPDLQGISQEKLDVLTKIIEESQGKSAKELIPFFLASSQQADSNGITFSDAETNVILDVLKKDMTPEEINKINTIKKLAKMISAKQRK